MRLQWTRSSDGYTETKCGRFRLVPAFNHGTRAWSYQLVDSQHPDVRRRVYTQSDGKEEAQRLVEKEEQCKIES